MEAAFRQVLRTLEAEAEAKLKTCPVAKWMKWMQLHPSPKTLDIKEVPFKVP